MPAGVMASQLSLRIFRRHHTPKIDRPSQPPCSCQECSCHQCIQWIERTSLTPGFVQASPWLLLSLGSGRHARRQPAMSDFEAAPRSDLLGVFSLQVSKGGIARAQSIARGQGELIGTIGAHRDGRASLLGPRDGARKGSSGPGGGQWRPLASEARPVRASSVDWD